ncbi:MAG TPA: hypothetical protein VLL52_21010 [Anaerolineae bacterium]|nr:hypothetical protein [Anaerolineae bacterium]
MANHTNTLTFPPTTNIPIISTTYHTVYRYQNQHRLRHTPTQRHLSGAHFTISPAPANQIIINLTPHTIPPTDLPLLTQLVHTIATNGLHGLKPFIGFTLTLQQQWFPPSASTDHKQRIWHRAIIDGLTGYLVRHNAFWRRPLQLPLDNNPLNLTQLFVTSYDFIDQSPGAEAVGGVSLLINPLLTFYQPQWPTINHWFIDLVSPNERPDPYAMTVYHTLKELNWPQSLPPSSIALFNMLYHPTDRRPQAYQWATEGAIQIGLFSP